jgi:hypothetical protein
LLHADTSPTPITSAHVFWAVMIELLVQCACRLALDGVAPEPDLAPRHDVTKVDARVESARDSGRIRGIRLR